MSKKVTLGGDRLGSGEKRKVELSNFERSTQNLNKVFRTTMSAGTLVPFLCEVGLPGDSFEIDLQSLIMTHPTIGPMLGSYKAQFDVFEVPIRNYQAQLHNNKLGIGLKMNTVKLPQIQLTARNPLKQDIQEGIDIDNYQINPSHILSYLGLRGIGIKPQNFVEEEQFQRIVERETNALPLLAYYDIIKNYYANKQEKKLAIISNSDEIKSLRFGDYRDIDGETSFYIRETAVIIDEELYTPSAYEVEFKAGNKLTKEEKINICEEIRLSANWEATQKPVLLNINEKSTVGWEENIENNNIYLLKIDTWKTPSKYTVYGYQVGSGEKSEGAQKPTIKFFDIEEVDDMRELILSKIRSVDAFKINKDNDEIPSLYRESLLGRWDSSRKEYISNLTNNQQGLALKTYQSDLYNNWLDSESVVGGEGSIAELSKMKVDLQDNQQTEAFLYMDELVIKRKVYNMLNDILVSGGSYNDWINAVYDHEGALNSEIPIYCGGLSKELIFDEVVSNAETEESPLGSLAGRGKYNNKHKGGRVHIKINEPSYIMGIVSLTPRIDYSQGNKWDTDLKTLDDLHKPHLDGIGFQDLITEQMHWADTQLNGDSADSVIVTKRSAGKIPAWSNYMTNVNEVRGNFAIANNQMFMTLNRRYDIDEEGRIKDLTTYVDPSKFNYIFADTRLDAQNFWMQIAIDMTVRRKISAKVMPR